MMIRRNNIIRNILILTVGILITFATAEICIADVEPPFDIYDYEFKSNIDDASYLEVTFKGKIPSTIEINNVNIWKNPCTANPDLIYSGNKLYVFWNTFCVKKGDIVKFGISFKNNIEPNGEGEWHGFLIHNTHPTIAWSDFKIVGKIIIDGEQYAAAISCNFLLLKNEYYYPPDSLVVPGPDKREPWKIDAKWDRDNSKVISILQSAEVVRNGIPSPVLLNHEQGHWDLCEIFALKLTVRLMNIKVQGSGSTSDEAKNDAKTKLGAEIKKIMANTHEEERTVSRNVYDSEKETDHGKKAAEQTIWNEAIENCLRDLKTNIDNKDWIIPLSCDNVKKIGNPLPLSLLSILNEPIYKMSDSDSDIDDDGITDQIDNCLIIYNPLQKDFNDDGLGDSCTDADKDGILDDQELEIGTDPQNTDSDKDLVIDGIELAVGTNPLLRDTDGDGINDLDENMLIIPEPFEYSSIESSDRYGRKKDIFFIRAGEYVGDDFVYLIGDSLPSDQTFPIYIVNDSILKINETIPTPIVATTAYTDSNGMLPVQQIWTPDIPGYYDIILDINFNNIFDIDDVLDDMDVGGAGFLVKSKILGYTFRLFGLIILIICMLIICIYNIIKR